MDYQAGKKENAKERHCFGNENKQDGSMENIAKL